MKGKAELAAASTICQLDVTYGTDADTEKAYRQWVSGELFPMLGLKPTLGRLLTANDDRVGEWQSVCGDLVRLLAAAIWTRPEGDRTDSSAWATTCMTIVGVGPKGFTGTEPGTVTDIFVPAKMEPSF